MSLSCDSLQFLEVSMLGLVGENFATVGRAERVGGEIWATSLMGQFDLSH